MSPDCYPQDQYVALTTIKDMNVYCNKTYNFGVDTIELDIIYSKPISGKKSNCPQKYEYCANKLTNRNQQKINYLKIMKQGNISVLNAQKN